MSISKFIITAYDISTYCKITRVEENAKTSYTISFGGTNYYCIVVSISSDTPTEAYIDRIESNEKCFNEGKTKYFVKLALWTIKIKFPLINKFTLNDDSHIDCTKGIKTHKLNLAYEYILKYNKTWYEENFKAQLPENLTKTYKDGLLILDKPLQTYEIMKDRLYELQKYACDYENARSPRDFMTKLREKYKENYCFEVSKWLTKYMISLKINIFQQQWYIDKSHIAEPPNYTIKQTVETLRGGYKRLNKTIKNSKRFTFGPYNEGHSLGTYETFE